MARDTSRLRIGGLAHLPQVAHRQAVGRVQGRAGRSAVLWMDRQSHQTDRRRPLRAQIHTAQSRQQLVDRNITRYNALKAAKKLAAPGLARSPEGRPVVDGASSASVPAYIEKALKLDPKGMVLLREPGTIASQAIHLLDRLRKARRDEAEPPAPSHHQAEGRGETRAYLQWFLARSSLFHT